MTETIIKPDEQTEPLGTGRVGAEEAAASVKAKKKSKPRKGKKPVVDSSVMTPEQAKAMADLALNAILKPPLKLMHKTYEPALKQMPPEHGLQDYSFELSLIEEDQMRICLMACAEVMPNWWWIKYMPFMALAISATSICITRISTVNTIRKVLEGDNTKKDKSPDSDGSKR